MFLIAGFGHVLMLLFELVSPLINSELLFVGFVCPVTAGTAAIEQWHAHNGSH